MVDVSAAILLLVAICASFFAAWSIGAGSSGSTPFAPAVGANAISTMQAAFIVGILGFAGAVLQGGAITETVGEGLIEGTTLSPLAAAIALTIAATSIAAGIFKGYPIATTFAITGSVTGVGLAMGGDPAWRTYTEIVLFWLLTPIVVAPPAYAITKILRSDRSSERTVVTLLAALIGAVFANMEFLLLGPPGEEASIATTVATGLPVPFVLGQVFVTGLVTAVVAGVVHRDLKLDSVGAQRRFLLTLGGLVAFTAGGGKVGLAVGPLLPLFEDVWGPISVAPVLIFGGVGILLGTWMAASRMIKALSQDYSELGPRRAIAILIPSFLIAQVGIFYGLPMSFNQIFIAAIAGTGYAVGRETMSEKKFVVTALAWIGSLVLGFIAGYAVYVLISGGIGI